MGWLTLSSSSSSIYSFHPSYQLIIVYLFNFWSITIFLLPVIIMVRSDPMPLFHWHFLSVSIIFQSCFIICENCVAINNWHALLMPYHVKYNATTWIQQQQIEHNCYLGILYYLPLSSMHSWRWWWKTKMCCRCFVLFFFSFFSLPNMANSPFLCLVGWNRQTNKYGQTNG